MKNPKIFLEPYPQPRRFPIEIPSSVDTQGDYAGRTVRIRMFPAILRDRTAPKPERLQEPGQGSCYFHPDYEATAVCSHSGRFLCSLCAVPWKGETISFDALLELRKQRHADLVPFRAGLAKQAMYLGLASIVLPPLALWVWVICLFKRKEERIGPLPPRWGLMTTGFILSFLGPIASITFVWMLLNR